MPHETTTAASLLAHCADPRCVGNAQTAVRGTRRTVSYTYGDLGGDANMPGIERSMDYLEFADQADAVCPTCQGPRVLTDQRRVSYAPLSGHSPDGLLQIQDAAIGGDL